MPLIQKKFPPESAQHLSLVAGLAAELLRAAPAGPEGAPQIIEEEQRGGYFHVTVLWDAWKDVDHEERGRIIMDAYEQQRPTDVANITVALGLTHEDARRLGVKT